MVGKDKEKKEKKGKKSRKSKKNEEIKLSDEIKPIGLLPTLRNNTKFCDALLSKNKLTLAAEAPMDPYDEYRDLVYNTSGAMNPNAEAFAAIMELLMQLQASQSDQNVFVQNNTVVKEQILNQLKNEVLRVRNDLSKTQIKNLEVVSSNNFDEKTLTEIIKSLLEEAKKKLIADESVTDTIVAEQRAKYITLEKMSRNYVKLLGTVQNHEKLVKNIVNNRTFQQSVINKQYTRLDPKVENILKKNEREIQQQSKKFQNIKTVTQKNVKALETINKSYENILVKKTSPVSSVLKLKSKYSQINVLSQPKTVFTDVVKEGTPRYIHTSAELVNKITETKNIDEIQENVTLATQQREEDRVFYNRNINRIYEQIEKIYSNKTIARNITEIIKSGKFGEFNLDEIVNRHVLKLTGQHNIFNRIKNIYETTAERQLANRIIDKNEFVNKIVTTHLSTEEREVLDEVLNLRQVDFKFDKKFINTIQEKVLLMQNQLVKNKVYDNVVSNAVKAISKMYETESFRNKIDKFSIVNLETFKNTEFEEHLTKLQKITTKKGQKSLISIHRKRAEQLKNSENINLSQDKFFSELVYKEDASVLNVNEKQYFEDIKNKADVFVKNIQNKSKLQNVQSEKTNFAENIISTNLEKIYKEDNIIKNVQEIENIIQKDVFVTAEKIINEKLNLITKKSKRTMTEINKLKPLDVITKGISEKATIWDSEDIYKFTPLHIKESIKSDQDIENVISRNILNVLSPKIMRSKSFSVKQKNIYKNIVQNQRDRYIEKIHKIKKELLIDEPGILERENEYRSIDKSHMTVKESELKAVAKAMEKKVQPKKEQLKEPKIEMKKVVQDDKGYEIYGKPSKGKAEKILSKGDVKGIVESYLRGINVESISNTVIGRVEQRIARDRKRYGVM